MRHHKSQLIRTIRQSGEMKDESERGGEGGKEGGAGGGTGSEDGEQSRPGWMVLHGS